MVETIRTARNYIETVDVLQFLELEPNELFLDIQLFNFSSGPREIANTFTINGITKSQSVGYQITQTILRSFRAYVNIYSLENLPPLMPEITDSDLVFAIKTTEQELTNEAYGFELLMLSNGVQSSISNYRLQNRRPGYYLNLMRFITDKDEYLGDTNTQFIGRFRDIGYGFPTNADSITFFAEMEEIGIIYPFLQETEKYKIELSGFLGGVGGGNTADGELKITVGGGSPYNLTVYYQELEPVFPKDLNSQVKQEIQPVENGALMDLSAFFRANGAGYYFIGFRFFGTDSFWNIPLVTSAINPPENAELLTGECSDSSQGLTTAQTINVIHVTNPDCVISLNFSIPN